MKFIADQGSLAKLIADCNSATTTKGNMPILANLKLELDNNQLTVTGSDLEIQISGTIEVEQVESGSITVPAKKFLDIVKSVTGAVDFTLESDEKANTGYTAIIRSGRSRFKLQTLPATEFPDIQKTTEDIGFTCPSHQFSGAIQRTQYAMANQDVRYYLNGMMFEIASGENIIVVATDGHRLVKTELEATLGGKVESATQYIIPRNAALELSKIANNAKEDISVGFSANHVFLHAGDRKVASKLIDGNFPDYKRVIPTPEQTIEIDRFELRSAFQRVAITSNEKYRGITMSLKDNSITLSSNNPEQDEGEESLILESKITSEKIIGVNANYMLDVLNNAPDETIKFGFTCPSSSMKIETSHNTIGVVMPVRL